MKELTVSVRRYEGYCGKSENGKFVSRSRTKASNCKPNRLFLEMKPI